MRFYLVLLLLLSSLLGWAQPIENTTTSEMGMRPKPDPNQFELSPIAEEVTPTMSDFKDLNLPVPEFSKPDNKSIFDKPKFETPDFGIATKLNKEFQREQDQNLEQFKRNQFFGEFKTESKYIRLVYRDHIYFDGDRVQVLMNDRVILANALLESSYKSIQIDLKIGFNKIEIIALNQGTSGPNTAEFQVYDDKGELISSNQWELATGFKGTIILSKDK